MAQGNTPRARHSPRNGRNGGTGASTRAKTALVGAVAVVAVLSAAVVLRHSSSSTSLASNTSLATGSAGAGRTTAPSPTPSPAATIRPPSSWKLVFHSDFSGNTLDSSVWDTCYPSWKAGSAGCTNFGNHEEEWYLPSQVQVHDGLLKFTAKHELTPGVKQTGHHHTFKCRSGMVTSYPGLDFKYGFVQVASTVPFGNGLWPALWLAASNKKWPPEIDMLEHWGSDPYVKAYLHPRSGIRQGGIVYTSPGLSTGYHVFSLYWTSSRLSWFVDGHLVLTTTTGIPKQKMYLTFNLADTSNKPGTCNGTMKIKSVKVWRPVN